jgi:hypothetical protein
MDSLAPLEADMIIGPNTYLLKRWILPMMHHPLFEAAKEGGRKKSFF